MLNLEEHFCIFKIFEMSAIFKMVVKRRHKKWAVKIQHCPISKFDMWVHNLPTYEMALKSDNVEFVRYCGGHFQNGHPVEIFNVGNQFGTSLSTHISNYF
jgi:hypothetical protein